MVLHGYRNISIISALLKQYVINELGEKDESRSRFFPQRRCIRNIVDMVKREIRWSKIDLENAEQLVKNVKEKSNGLSSIYFRPCTLQETPRDLQDEWEEENETSKNNLLFVYQSKEMQELFGRYGKDGVLLDATYKTCKWALPLYFLVVKTNVGFQPVAVFITQYETQQAIFEALNIINEWNPGVVPKFGMVDFAMEEILALEFVFPKIEVFICTFHREQAWTRWLSKANISSCVPRAEALKKLRAIANTPTEKKLQEE